jgi:hypothetical protein
MNPFGYYNEKGLNDRSNTLCLYPIKYGEIGKSFRFPYFNVYTPNTNDVKVFSIGFTLQVDDGVDDIDGVMLLDIFKVFNNHYKNSPTIDGLQFIDHLTALRTPGLSWMRVFELQPMNFNLQEHGISIDIALLAIEREGLPTLEAALKKACKKDLRKLKS